MRVADYLAHFLKSQGVTHVFGLPGGDNIVFLEALRQKGLDFVLMHHEAAAGFAADVTGQLTDCPGVCLSTVGPGSLNLLATATSATLERSPLLAITADLDQNLQSRVTHMKVDQAALYKIGTKGSFKLTPETILTDLELAWNLAQTPPRGAVHLALPASVAAQSIVVSPTPKMPRPTSSFDPSQLEVAKPLLQQAEQLIFLVGIGVEAATAQAEVLDLAESWQIPVMVTPKAKGHFPENHPLFSGCFTAYGDQPLRQALAEADLVLGIGLDGVDLATSIWDIRTPLVNFSVAMADDPVFRPVFALDGDLRQMLPMIQPWRQPWHQGLDLAADLRRAVIKAVTTNFPIRPGRIRLADLINALRDAMPADGVITLDVGAFKLVFLQQWHCNSPKSLFTSNGLSAMGYAVPGALAVKLARPECPVVAIVGDGALLMYSGELETIAHQAGAFVVLVIVDDALALIRLKQLRASVPVHGTEFGPVDYTALAAAYGLGYQLVDSKDSAKEILSHSLQQNRPVLIEVRIHLEEYNHFI